VLHGFGGDPDQPHIVATCEALANAGVAALRFAYRDHRPPRMTLASGLADAAGAIRVLKAHPDVPERLGVVGFSFGGTVAALVAGRDSRVRAAVLAAAPAEFGGDPKWKPLAELSRTRARVLLVWGSRDSQVAFENAERYAAVLSQAVGKPVRVAYSRSDEHAWENYGQAYTIKISGAVDSSSGKAKLTAWRRDAWTSTRGNRPGPPANLPSGILMGFPEPALVAGTITTPSQALNSVDGSNSAPAYIVPAARLTNHTVRRTFMSGPLRSPARIQNTFANESMMDELAYVAGVDPVNFRSDNLTDPRMIAVTQAAAQMASWPYRPAASKIGTGRYLTGWGVSSVHYEGTLGYNGAVVNLTVDTKTGKVVVNHVWSAQDCGPALNPDGMKAQAEGCVMQGISRSLIEELKWNADGITSHDWVSYPVIRFPALPKFDFQIINRPDQPVVGAGEVLITNMPAAIANAIFDATGKRMRQLPFTPARVRAALAT